MEKRMIMNKQIEAWLDEMQAITEQEYHDKDVYQAWRKWEAYSVPVTEEGLAKSDMRFQAFKAGWLSAMEVNNEQTD
jgi:hypothetical protein